MSTIAIAFFVALLIGVALFSLRNTRRSMHELEAFARSLSLARAPSGKLVYRGEVEGIAVELGRRMVPAQQAVTKSWRNVSTAADAIAFAAGRGEYSPDEQQIEQFFIELACANPRFINCVITADGVRDEANLDLLPKATITELFEVQLGSGEELAVLAEGRIRYRHDTSAAQVIPGDLMRQRLEQCRRLAAVASAPPVKQPA